MKKSLILIGAIIFSIGSICLTSSAMPNPWVNCGDDISCGAKKAGFNFPLRVQNYSVRAMDDMIEIKFPLDKKREVTVRKSTSYQGNDENGGIGDISGVYVDYPIMRTVTLNNGVIFNVRGDKKRYYVASFAAESGYYSLYCPKGFNQDDIEYLYAIIAEAEAPRQTGAQAESYSLEELRIRKTVDNVVETLFTQDCFPRTLQRMGVTKNCFERANLFEDSVCSASEIRMIKEYYKKGYKHDPLNGCSEYCAE